MSTIRTNQKLTISLSSKNKNRSSTDTAHSLSLTSLIRDPSGVQESLTLTLKYLDHLSIIYRDPSQSALRGCMKIFAFRLGVTF